MLKLFVRTDNAAFADGNLGAAVGWVIHDTANRVENEQFDLKLRDINGNVVGRLVEVENPFDELFESELGENYVTLDIGTDNAAFEDNKGVECARIMIVAAQKICDGEVNFKLRDANGNTVGKVEQVSKIVEKEKKNGLPDRKDYMDGKITHREYYSAVAAAIGVTDKDLPVGAEQICRSKDEHFNDIPLEKWDALHSNVVNKARAAGYKSWSQSDSVCVLKAVAGQLRDKGLDHILENAEKFPIKKVIDFGKVDYLNNGRKDCPVTVEVDLVDGRLSITGNVWNARKTDCYLGGQCREELVKLLRGNSLFQEISAVWDKWHLNDMHAGTPKQEEVLAAHKAEWDGKDHYDWACEMLEVEGLLVDDGHKYGSKWLKQELPAEVVQFVVGLGKPIEIADKSFMGKIVGYVRDDSFYGVAIQDIGKRSLVFHDVSKIGISPVIGSNVTISYDGRGKGSVEPRSVGGKERGGRE